MNVSLRDLEIAELQERQMLLEVANKALMRCLPQLPQVADELERAAEVLERDQPHIPRSLKVAAQLRKDVDLYRRWIAATPGQ